jgi:hypothetical protein
MERGRERINADVDDVVRKFTAKDAKCAKMMGDKGLVFFEILW